MRTMCFPVVREPAEWPGRPEINLSQTTEAVSANGGLGRAVQRKNGPQPEDSETEIIIGNRAAEMEVICSSKNQRLSLASSK